jgi:hypothetical protein
MDRTIGYKGKEKEFGSMVEDRSSMTGQPIVGTKPAGRKDSLPLIADRRLRTGYSLFVCRQGDDGAGIERPRNEEERMADGRIFPVYTG